MQMHAGAIMKLLYGLCVCTRDNPLAIARRLTPCADVETIQ